MGLVNRGGSPVDQSEWERERDEWSFLDDLDIIAFTGVIAMIVSLPSRATIPIR